MRAFDLGRFKRRDSDHRVQPLEDRPANVQARCWHALFYLQWARGQMDEGVAEARRARALDPLSAYVTLIEGVALVTAGRAAEGAEVARRATELDSDSFVAHWVLGTALSDAGRHDEAEPVLERAAAMSHRHHFAITSLTRSHARRGRPDLARHLHQELLDRAAAGCIPSTQLILTADAAGDRDEAIAHAQRALAEREPPLALLARHFPDFRDLRQDPRFLAILREMDVPWPVEDDR